LGERKTVPEVGCGSPEINLSIVDLPMPFEPTTETIKKCERGTGEPPPEKLDIIVYSIKEERNKDIILAIRLSRSIPKFKFLNKIGPPG
jgi:hypothetical protein